MHDDGFRAFYDRAAPGLYRALVLVLRDRQEAEDVLQESFLRAAQRWQRVQGLERPEAWVRRVAMNLCVDRSRRRRPPEPAAEPVLPDELAVEVALALQALPLVQRQAVVLHHLVGLTVDEVAAELGRRRNTVRTQLARGRQRLAGLLDDTLEVPL